MSQTIHDEPYCALPPPLISLRNLARTRVKAIRRGAIQLPAIASMSADLSTQSFPPTV